MTPTGIDHLVLTVRDLEATCDFYADLLGGSIVTFGDDRTAVQLGGQKINLHPIDNDVDLVADDPTPGSGDFCVLTETALDTVERELVDAGVEIIAGPVEQTGTRGPMNSLYVRDPDANLVEIASYSE